MAMQQGLGSDEISKLVTRLDAVKSSRASTALDKPGVRGLRQNLDSTKSAGSEFFNSTKSEIFGIDFFRNGNRNGDFETNLNIPTPRDYELGAGDEILIDLFGSSEQYYQAVVNPDGNILLENIGPIFVSGLDVDEAERRIRSKLSRLYTGLIGSSPQTFLNVNLGNIRSISVSIVGEVETPGTYTLSAFSTVFNALYSVGGISENGTLREIRVFRDNTLVKTLDAYQYLINGIDDNNIRLQSNDVIVVGPYTNRVRISGEVKRPGLYELAKDETLNKLVEYAGGFTESAFIDQISVVRNSGKEKVVNDVFESQFDLFEPKAGDVYNVNRVLDRFSNRVQIQGAVFRPGNYSIQDGLTAKQLIDKADGLKGEASRQRAIIIRSKEDLSTENLSFNLGDLINGTIQDIPLQREDILRVFSIYDLKEEGYVEISGEVNNGGVFSFSENMKVGDLISLAGGLKSSASNSRVEITRRLGNSENGDVSQVIVLDVGSELGVVNSENTLQPYDHVVVRKNPDFFTPQFVAVEGQVKFPGDYAISNQTERISSLLQRAGGITQYGFVEGATLLRKTEFYSESSDMELRIDDLEALLEKFQSDPQSLSESQLAQLQRVNDELSKLTQGQSENQDLSSFAKRERLREIVKRNTLYGDVELKESEAIGIDLKKIIENPGSKQDLILQEGDVLVIPKVVETVRLRGRVLYPTTVLYENNRSLKHFIDQAGGFDNRAKRRGTYVIYANGSVARTKRFLFFKTYPKVTSGAEIIVPAKPPKIPFSPSEIIGITSGVATLALLISQINF